ncbi:zinc finger CCCH domain-containing protein 14 [Dorcoceras hygrometricum]|uniref:Zinc finger CCCH domain-containing protein 14 n=1 Tax=Dorcoceras hygrometricum TaxID=472368 RepID=A0A2Z7D8C6_9LAMI|nr:zinc finger CCCH domain-containing protein 14 [Dorcoceras hygrometricum]
MQKDNTVYDDFTNSVAGKSTVVTSPMNFSLSNPFLSPRSTNCLNLNPSYSTLFKNYGSQSLSDAVSVEGALASANRQMRSSSSILEFQQLYNRHTVCIGQLHDSIEEVDKLRRENNSLRVRNDDLGRRLALLTSRDRILSDFNRLNISSPVAASPAAGIATPRPFIEHNRIEQRSTERESLPKSIAVRSSGYLKINRPGQETTRQKSVCQSSPESQRVYVPGSKNEEESLEFEVYNQGMFKTELCNKWQETGACPYGDNCQFAHGINELRPVIRHPRYKTEVCRMVLTGDICPYGHRCHFRHSLTEQERLMAAASPQ